MVYPDRWCYNSIILSKGVTTLATEWATSMTQTVTIPSADADDTFNEALDELAVTAREFGQGDKRRIVAVEVDLVKALRSARAHSMHIGRDSGYAIDRVLLRVIDDYIMQIRGEWA